MRIFAILLVLVACGESRSNIVPVHVADNCQHKTVIDYAWPKCGYMHMLKNPGWACNHVMQDGSVYAIFPMYPIGSQVHVCD